MDCFRIVAKDAYVAVMDQNNGIFHDEVSLADPNFRSIILVNMSIEIEVNGWSAMFDNTIIYFPDTDLVEFQQMSRIAGSDSALFMIVMSVIDHFQHKLLDGPTLPTGTHDLEFPYCEELRQFEKDAAHIYVDRI